MRYAFHSGGPIQELLLPAADYDRMDAVLGSDLVDGGFFPEHFRDYLCFVFG